MTNLNNLVTQTVNQIQSGRPVARSDGVNIDNWAANQIDKLFASLCSQHPAWRSFLKSEQEIGEYKRQLVLAMMENGINKPEMLKLGIQKSRRSDKPWMPGVGEFVSWCKPTPEDFGMPAFNEALLEVNRYIWTFHDVVEGRGYRGQEPHKWSHPAVYWAAIQTPSSDRRGMNAEQWRKVFQRSYEYACKKVMSGEDLSGCIPKALPSPDVDTRTDDEKKADWAEARNKIKQIMGELNDSD